MPYREKTAAVVQMLILAAGHLYLRHGAPDEARMPPDERDFAAIEAGEYSPSLEAAFRIAEVFDVPLDEVFRWEAKD